MSVATFQPIHQPDVFSSSSKNSRSNSSLSSVDSSENESPVVLRNNNPQRTDKINNNNNDSANSRKPPSSNHNGHASRDTSRSPSSTKSADRDEKRILLRRSSSAMRVRELRDVLTKMTTDVGGGDNEEKEAPVTGSQNARLLVASQQCLVSRLQDLRNELESMDSEVTRVKHDIVNSRRFFSAMTGIPCGPEWPTVRQIDSAYTSPTSFISRSTDISPYSSDNDYPSYNSNAAFQQLQHFQEQPRSKVGQLSRSDSCSSFMSWRSEAEMATLFPDETSSPQITPRAGDDQQQNNLSSTTARIKRRAFLE